MRIACKVFAYANGVEVATVIVDKVSMHAKLATERQLKASFPRQKPRIKHTAPAHAVIEQVAVVLGKDKGAHNISITAKVAPHK